MDNNHDISIEEIYIPAKNDKETYLCEDFIVYPEGKEKNGGYLMGIIEIRATAVAESEKIIQTIINTLKDNYYDQINSSPDPKKLNLETVFEYALQKTNSALVEMIQIGHINLVLENLNYLIAVAKPNLQNRDIDFTFAHQGLISVYLLHKTKQNNYKVIDVVGNTPRSREDQNDKIKIFSSTLSGKVSHRDALYICSEIFGNYIPAHKVNKILSTNDLSTSVDYFKNLINNVKNNSHLTYCALFMKMEEKRSLSEEPISQKSINNLISTTEKTEKYLTPTFALNIRDLIRRAFSGMKSREKATQRLQSPDGQKRVSFGILKYIFNIFKIIFIFIGKTFSKIFAIITGKQKLHLLPLKKTLAIPKTIISRSAGGLKSLHKINKTILASLLVLVILLVSGIFWVRHREQTKQEQTAYAAQVQVIKELINNAQVNLIYKNEEQSLALIKEAEEKTSYLPQASASRQANYLELQNQASAIKNKLLHVENVVPQLITEVGANETPVQLTKISKIGDKLYVNAKDADLYEVALGDKSVNLFAHSQAGDLATTIQDDKNLMFITNQSKLIQLNATDKSFSTKSINWPNSAEIKAAILYNSKIYALDTVNQQIAKYQASGDNYGSPQNWIKDKKDADLSDGASLAIDGNIYVLTKKGKIYKFYTGKLEDFEARTIEPALTEAQKIYASADLPYLYISEAGGKRIIFLNKDGSLSKQYLFDTLDSAISDFTVSGDQIYMVSGNKVYSATIQ